MLLTTINGKPFSPATAGIRAMWKDHKPAKRKSKSPPRKAKPAKGKKESKCDGQGTD